MEGSVKLISLLRPAQTGAAWEAFVSGQLAAGVAGLQRLVFNEVLPVDVRGGADAPPPFVAIIEAWFADRASADGFAASVRDHGGTVQLYVDALLINDIGRRPLPNKIMVTLKRRADLSRAQAQKHWRTRHVEVGLVEHNAADFLQLYFQNHVFDSDQEAGSACDFDGMPEFWVDPADLAEVGADSPVMRAIAEDEVLFVDRTAIVTMMVAERELFVAPGTEGGWPVRESSLHEVVRAG
ncbi:EthD family reductase [Novosphingobium lentum]|uniref:EthD family reductase n=1 Tax=Novosphingobium lentum TaxID=145287 RepID=UPI0008321A96|nr:EthD family reductase [Novosphingobium lentum]